MQEFKVGDHIQMEGMVMRLQHEWVGVQLEIFGQFIGPIKMPGVSDA